MRQISGISPLPRGSAMFEVNEKQPSDTPNIKIIGVGAYLIWGTVFDESMGEELRVAFQKRQ
jgi:cell division GTPase FtsZ